MNCYALRINDGAGVTKMIQGIDVAASLMSSAGQPQSGTENNRLIFWPTPDFTLPLLKWEYDEGWNWRTPGMHLLERFSWLQAGKPADWLDAYSDEAIFVDPDHCLPAEDLRASLTSGPTGPAPLPEGAEWPLCPSCGIPYLFSQSLDMRDTGFAALIPGGTMVIFACNECLDAGEWANCSKIIWLEDHQPIEPIQHGPGTPPMQWKHWYGGDGRDDSKLPRELEREFHLIPGSTKLPPLNFSASYGTKAGGSPAFLQSDPVVFDCEGVLMEYIAQIATAENIRTGGFGYIYFSTRTGETRVEFQNT